MINQKFFFNQVRLHLFDGSLTTKQVEGLSEILKYWEAHHSKKDDRFLAYILATVHHETGRKIQPVEEIGKGKGKNYGSMIKHSGAKYTSPAKLYYGRGFVQLTWFENYENVGKKLKLNLLSNPELVLQVDISTQIVIEGMIDGWFTGKKLSDYFSTSKEKWLGARYIINGQDKNELIKSYALKYYAAISYTV